MRYLFLLPFLISCQEKGYTQPISDPNITKECVDGVEYLTLNGTGITVQRNPDGSVIKCPIIVQ